MNSKKDKPFNWQTVDDNYVDVYETLDTTYRHIYTRSAAALVAMARPKPGQTLVDLACGTGTSTRVLADAVAPGGKVLGIDFNAAMLERARYRFQDRMDISLAFAPIQDFTEVLKTYGWMGNINAIFSSFSYFYVYDFHEQLQQDMYDALSPGGVLAFNIGTFLSTVSDGQKAYNTFTTIFNQTLDTYLKQLGYTEGMDPTPPRQIPIYRDWDLSLLRQLGYREIQSQIWTLPMCPSDVYRYSIEGFYRFGLGTGSETLMHMKLNQRIAIMYQVLDSCAEEMDRSGEKSCILNVVARK